MMIYSFIILLSLVLTLSKIYSKVLHNGNYWKSKGVKSFKPLPFIGNIWKVLIMQVNMGDFFRSIYENTSEPFVGLHIFDCPSLLVKDLNIIRHILVRDFDHFVNRPMAETQNNEDLSRNFIFFMKNPRWKTLRSKLAKTFSTGKLSTMSVMMKRHAEEMMEYIESKEGNIEVLDMTSKYVVNSIMSTYFDLEADCFKDEHSTFRDLAHSMFDKISIVDHFKALLFFLSPKLVKNFKLTFMSVPVNRCFKETYSLALNKRVRENVIKNDLLQMLLIMSKEKWTIDGIHHFDENLGASQLGQIFLAAYETSTYLLSYVIFELASKPHIQLKIKEEISNCNEIYEPFSYESIRAMKYMKNVIYETLRIYPILPFLDRECLDKYTIPGTNITLSRGDRVYISVYGMHMDEKYFKDPYVFNPDRFSGEKSKLEQNFAFLGFGEGPRSCIGRRAGMLTVSYALAHILSKFKLELPEDSGRNIELSKKDFLLKPAQELNVNFIPWND